MNFKQAVISAFVKTLDIKTRASRSEVWWLILFSILATLVVVMIDALLFPTIKWFQIAHPITGELQGRPGTTIHLLQHCYFDPVYDSQCS